MKQLFRYFLLLGISCNLLQAQGGKFTISGTLNDGETGELLSYVGVFFKGTQIGVNTNLDGFWTLTAPADTYYIAVSYYGYKSYLDTIILDRNIEDVQIRIFPLETTTEEVVITADGENPAHRIIRNAIKNKKFNRFDNIDAYEYESYNKLVITMDNISQKFLHSKLLGNVGDVVQEMVSDSLNNDTTKIKLAAFVSESVSRFYYKEPGLKKEEILAAKTSGVKGSEYNLLSSLFLQIDVYDNFIKILDRQFMSPVADGAFINYDYQIIQTDIDARDTLFGIQIIPKRPYDPVFKGKVYIDNRSWAINRIELSLNEDPNINFVENITIQQEYTRQDSFWVPVLLDMMVDFQNSLTKRKGGDGVGVIGRTTSYLSDYKINKPRDDKFYKQELLEVVVGATDKDSAFWAEKRPIPLDNSEQTGFMLVDSLKSRGVLDFYINTIRFITVGTKEFKYFEVGPYFYLFGFNQVEGPRGRLGVYTTDEFSKRIKLGAHLAYGLWDQKFKYMGEFRYRISQKPRLEIGISKMFEVEQAGFDDFITEGTSLMATLLRRVPFTQLNYFDENKASLYFDVRKGLAMTTYFRTKYVVPAFDQFFRTSSGDIGTSYEITELGLNFRLSFKEDYILSNGNKIYIGSKFPVFNLGYVKGFQGSMDGDFNYTETYLSLTQKLKMGRWGYSRYNAKVGQIFGTLPLASLHVFRGNQTYGFDQAGFNLMNYYEFIADRYIEACVDHHFEGYFLNRLPLIRKLKFKEIFTARLAYGTLTRENLDINTVAGNVIQLVAPDKIPYYEAGIGVENILKVLRVDGVWRLNYHKPDQPNFGVRIYLTVSF